VRPYAGGGAHALPNGLLLRADIHRLYDAGYVTVTPDYRFRVSRDLADDFHNGREYERFAHRAVTVPRVPADQPDRKLLDWHAAEVFRGSASPAMVDRHPCAAQWLRLRSRTT